MKPVSLSELRASMKAHFDGISEQGETLVVRRPGGKSVVLLSMDAYHALQSSSSPSTHPYQRQSQPALVADYSPDHRSERLQKVTDKRVLNVIDQLLEIHEKPHHEPLTRRIEILVPVILDYLNKGDVQGAKNMLNQLLEESRQTYPNRFSDLPLEVQEGVRQGMKDFEEGRTHDAFDVLEEMRQTLKRLRNED